VRRRQIEIESFCSASTLTLPRTANHYWWLDQGDGTCGMIQTQVGGTPLPQKESY
jgi:hypothetical protein